MIRVEQKPLVVLVTGAGGYMGRKVVDHLLMLGCEVVAVGMDLSKVADQAIKIEKDLFSINNDLFLTLKSPDVCLHLAWKDGFVHNSDAHIENLYKHYKFLTRLVDEGLKQLCVMGSMHEVGYYEGAIDENTPTNPFSLYGIAKNSLRQLMESYVNGKNVVFQWIRAYYIYGDDVYSNSIFSKILKSEAAGQAIFPFTSGKNKYDFILLDELSKQICAVVTQDKINGIINCCSGNPLSLSEVVEQFLITHHLNIRLEYGVFPDRPYDSPAVWGDNSKIQKILMSKVNK